MLDAILIINTSGKPRYAEYVEGFVLPVLFFVFLFVFLPGFSLDGEPVGPGADSLVPLDSASSTRERTKTAL
jgi:hypothetical protein